jgi:hypothetical protein
MTTRLTLDQVLSLAPDENARRSARALASSARSWSRLFRCEQAIWGECQGSGTDPYRCQVELDEPGFKCSCPSRKLPCKHALGLLLVYTEQPERFEVSEPPEWITTWLAKRVELGERRAAKAAGKAAPVDSAAQARRAAEREKKIRAGIDELDTWLCDLLRQGLASAQSQPFGFWENAAGRLVDAQAPGLARMVRAMAAVRASGDGWQGRLLEAISRLYLTMEGYRRLESLPADTQEDLRSVLGFTIKQEELLASAPALSDTWLVLGRHTDEENNLKTRRVWLWGASSRRAALLLYFSAGGNALEFGPMPGTAFPAELVFYPGAYPLRAAVRTQQPSVPLDFDCLPAENSLIEATAGYASALARFPWFERFPIAVKNVIPFHDSGEWGLCDDLTRWVPLSRTFLHGWRLLSISGGHPLAVFGEWNGEHLLPLSAWTEDRITIFPTGLD